MGQNVPLQDLCATISRAWYVEPEPEPSPFVALAMKLETTNEPLFLEVEEAKRLLLVMVHCGFRPNDAGGPVAPSLARCARRIGAFHRI